MPGVDRLAIHVPSQSYALRLEQVRLQAMAALRPCVLELTRGRGSDASCRFDFAQQPFADIDADDAARFRSSCSAGTLR